MNLTGSKPSDLDFAEGQPLPGEPGALLHQGERSRVLVPGTVSS